MPPDLMDDGVTGPEPERGRLCRTLELVLFMGMRGAAFRESNIACKLETLDFLGVSMIAPKASFSWISSTWASLWRGFSRFLYIFPGDSRGNFLPSECLVCVCCDPYLEGEYLWTSGEDPWFLLLPVLARVLLPFQLCLL